MGVLAYIPLMIAMLPGRELPVGTHLEIRLTCAVGTHASKPCWPVSAVLTTPVTIDDELFLPAGSKLTGQVKAARRVGHGIIHETAALELVFERVTLPDQTSYPISALVIEVDNARERVAGDGRILEERSHSKLLNRTTGYVRLAAGVNIHVKTLAVDIPKADIYFPEGVELTLALGESLLLAPPQPDATVPTLTDDVA